MNDKNILERLAQLRQELESYKTARQKEIDRFMAESGLKDYVSETNVHIASLQGKIDILEEMAKDIDVDEEETDE